ncbi:uncharacterized protein LOC131958614 [Physella acuta]|uniref:uncharacterized protein LOC131958614 n=1 Tax=Physella acuta TaxID=109671 RepID=UPI0027DB7AF4|nr:uncharacterized protein LOC131958614 [Physella acuta]
MNESEERRDRWCRREREKMETEARIEVERMKAEAAIEKERQEFELARMKNEGMKNITHIDMNHQSILSKLPKFQEDSENIDAYIRRFETVARTTGLSNTQWGTQLLVLIGGKALDACQGLSEDDMKDYRILKETLLEFFLHNEDSYRKKFHNRLPSKAEDFKNYVLDLKTTFMKWLETARVEMKVENIIEFILIDKVLNSVDKQLLSYIQERKPTTLKDLTDHCQKYIIAHTDRPIANKESEYESIFYAKATGDTAEYVGLEAGNYGYDNRRPRRYGTQTNGTRYVGRCFNCQQPGHMIRNCPHRHSNVGGNNQAAGQEYLRDTNTHAAHSHYSQQHRPRQDGNHNNGYNGHNSSPDNEGVEQAPLLQIAPKIPTLMVNVGAHTVEAVRDTGCSTIAVKSSYVEQHQYTGEWKMVEVFGGTVIRLPIALINIKSPYVTGQVRALVFERGSFDVIIGNDIERETIPQNYHPNAAVR